VTRSPISNTPIHTARLLIRPFTPDVALPAVSWFGDPGVTRFTPTGPRIILGMASDTFHLPAPPTTQIQNPREK
jgi:hypothetical protein